MSAVAAAVPLTAVQVADADLLEGNVKRADSHCEVWTITPPLSRGWRGAGWATTKRSCLAAFRGERGRESSAAAVTLLCRADARLLNLCDSLTNPLQSSKSRPPNTV